MTVAMEPNPSAGGEPSPNGEFGILEAYGEVETTRSQYLEACSQYAQKPVRQNGEAINVTVNAYAGELGKLLGLMLADTDTAAFVKDGQGLIIVEDEQRAAHINTLLGSETIKTLAADKDNFDKAASAITEEAENDEEAKADAIAFLIGTLETGLTNDTRKFLEEVGKSKRAKWYRRRDEAMKHAVDVGKTAVGTLIGAAILQAVIPRKR